MWPLLFLFPLAIAQNDSILEVLAAEARLKDHLFVEKNYRKEIPATFKRSSGQEKKTNETSGKPSTSHHPKTVNITLTYAKLLNINELEQTFKTIVEIFLVWEDERLQWNPEEFEGVDLLLLDRNSVWVPDVVPYDLSDLMEPIPPERQMVTIFPSGICGWYSSSIATFMCEINISDFPFDKQECAIKFSVYYSTNTELVLNGSVVQGGGDITTVGNNQWMVESSRVFYRTFSFAFHNWTFSEINFIFTLQRSDSYYVILIIIPSFVLTFLCICGLFWAPISFDTYMDKLNLGFAAILAMVLVLQITTDNIPKTSETPILSIYSLINLSLITFASMTVLAIGKFFTKRNCVKESPRFSWIVFVKKHFHLVLLAFYSLATVVNLVVLLSRKGNSKGKFIG